jgi:hypothetical protein
MAGSNGVIYSAWKRVGPPDYWIVGDTWVAMKLKNPTKTSAYYQVGIKRNGKQEWHTVHSLVCLAWYGQVPEGMECSHDNGNALDNRPSNLIYKTCSDNALDRTTHGTCCGGSRVSIKWFIESVRKLGIVS